MLYNDGLVRELPRPVKEGRMSDNSPDSLWNLMNLFFRAHPWHGVSIGEQAPEIVTVYVEMTPTDIMANPHGSWNMAPIYSGFIA